MYAFLSEEVQPDGDIYLAAMLAIKLYMRLREDPQTAFCSLYSDLESHQGLDRAGRSFLALTASRMVFHSNLRLDAMSCSQNMTVGNQSSSTILAGTR